MQGGTCKQYSPMNTFSSCWPTHKNFPTSSMRTEDLL